MGLIKAAVTAVGSTLHDQWKEYIKCDDLGNDILMKRVSTPNGIISKDIFRQLQEENGVITFTGISNDVAYEWTVFGSDLEPCKDCNLAISVEKKDAQKAVKALHEAFQLGCDITAEVKGDLPNV